ncbi:MAG: hypothetical protein GY742_11825 [Hyphomicrobiales bacterium]|nr:hypothetical protein [Hyphomicrobiales bacterium]
MMTTELSQTRNSYEIWNFAYHVFLRLLALFFIIQTIQVWMKAIGISAIDQAGFDTMPSHWRLVIAALCVLHPVTALGLWGLFAWGIAVWLLAVLVQLAMHLPFASLFGASQLLVVFHATCLIIFIIFQLALRFTTNGK